MLLFTLTEPNFLAADYLNKRASNWHPEPQMCVTVPCWAPDLLSSAQPRSIIHSCSPHVASQIKVRSQFQNNVPSHDRFDHTVQCTVRASVSVEVRAHRHKHNSTNYTYCSKTHQHGVRKPILIQMSLYLQIYTSYLFPCYLMFL